MQHVYLQFLAHPTVACFYFLLAFWLIALLAIKIFHLVERRPMSDGPSLIPLFPVLPAIALLAATAINAVLSPVGTLLVAAVHFIYMLWALWQTRKPSNSNK